MIIEIRVARMPDFESDRRPAVTARVGDSDSGPAAPGTVTAAGRDRRHQLRLYAIIFISIYYTRLFTIIPDFSITKTQLETIILVRDHRIMTIALSPSPKRRIFNLLHYDYFTYVFQHKLLQSIAIIMIHDYVHYFYREKLYVLLVFYLR